MPVRFQVDPDFYDHPKTIGMSADAYKLWVRAGSFSAAKLLDGFLADDVITETLGADKAVADELCRRRLWKRVKGGYQFHEYGHRNLLKDRVEGDRERDRKRKRAERRDADPAEGQSSKSQVDPGNVRTESERNPDGIPVESGRSPDGSVSVSESESVSGSGHAAAGGPEPPPQCPKHLDDPDPPPCRACKAARIANEEWSIADAERRRNAPKCRHHRGQPAHNCALCRAEALGAA